MSEENTETQADLTEEGELGTPVDDSPAEDDSTPVDDSPDPETVSAPEEGVDGKEPEKETVEVEKEGDPDDPELLKKRMGDKDRHIREQQEALSRQESELAYYKTQAQTQTPMSPPSYPTDQADDALQHVFVGFMKQQMGAEYERHNAEYFKAHPEDKPTERIKAINMKLAKLGWNVRNVTPEQLAQYPDLLEEARRMAFFDEEKIKAKSDAEKKAQNKKAEAARAKVGAGVSDSSIRSAQTFGTGDKPKGLKDCGDWIYRQLESVE